MKILVISDTHGRDENFERVLEKDGKPDMLIHLGDIEGSERYIESAAGCRCEMIAGNNDYFSDLPMEKEIYVGNHKIFMTHGHYYNVSVETQTIVNEGIGRGADIVMFGHIHRSVYEDENGILLLNPGSLSLPRQIGHEPTYALLTIDDDDDVKCEIRYLK